ncbi:MAG: hypothetical protein ACRDNS_29555 [Trebonia sp.]
MAFTQVTLTGAFHGETGAAQAGTLTFTLARSMSNDGTVIAPAPVQVILDSTGSFSQVLVANTDQDTVPQGVWCRVTEQIAGRARDYFVLIPGTAVDEAATLTQGSDLVSLSSLLAMGWMVGCMVTGAGIPANTTVAAVLQGSNQLKLSAAVSASGASVAVTVSPPATVSLADLTPGDTQWL